MGAVNAQLLQLVRVFESQGVNNAVQVAESVAFLLLLRAFVPDEWQQLSRHVDDLDATFARHQVALKELFPSEKYHLPEPPSVRIASRVSEITDLIDQAISIANRSDLGTFFQRDIRSALLRTTTSGQYPTPHHIAHFIASLAVNSSTGHVLDPTAGTGGLLVAAQQIAPQAQYIGIDYDPQWAGMGSANLLLNREDGAGTDDEFHLGLALKRYPQIVGRFDAVLMNPPFGGAFDVDGVTEALGADYGRDRTTVLGALALAALKEAGIAAFLVPSGVLFGGGGARYLRNVLTSDYHLEAVIALPGDSFQPYSQVAAHLVVAWKAAAGGPTWMCSLTSDGYPNGAGRDLAEDPRSDLNELPRTGNLVVASRENHWKTRLVLDNQTDVQTVQIGTPELDGAAVKLTQLIAEVTWQLSALPTGIMVRLRSNDAPIGWLFEPYGDDEFLAFRHDDIEEVTDFWQTRLFRSDRAADIPVEWQAEEGVTLQLNNDSIVLSRESRSVSFGNAEAASDESAIACLLSADGSPLTPWMSMAKGISATKFSEDYGALAIEDASGTLIGWVLSVITLGDEQIPGMFFIHLRPLENELLFTRGGNAHYAILQNGWIGVSDDNRLYMMYGTALNPRADTAIQGVAVGHMPGGTSTEHTLFGALLPVSESLLTDMRPSRFLPEQSVLPLGTPVELIASIRRAQAGFSTRMDSLLGMIGDGLNFTDAADEIAPLPTWITTMLDARQRELLDSIRSKHTNNRPETFTLQTLREWSGSAFTADRMSQHVHMFIQLGLIKEVHYRDKDGHHLNGYRLITNKDLRFNEDAALAEMGPTQ
jgi:hypothetical protein